MTAEIYRDIEDAPGSRPCANEGCPNILGPNVHPNRKYCGTCRTNTQAKKRWQARVAAGEVKPKLDKVCHTQGCSNIVPAGRSKFCSGRCAARHAKRITRYDERLAEVEALFADASEATRRKAIELERKNRFGKFANRGADPEAHEPDSPDEVPSALRVRRGPLYDKFKAAGYLERIEAGVITPADAAKMFETSAANVNGWMAAYAIDEANRVNNITWSPPPRAQRALEDFALFRRTYFKDEWGRPYVTTDYHLRWIEAILHAMKIGGRLQILSPPRHGKSDLLIHFCIWMILKRPTIRILWVGLNADIASQSTDVIRDLLETNEALVADFIPPGETFKPTTGESKPWQAAKFTVSTRPFSLKSPTMLAIGKKGKLLSRDVDLAVIDDILDHDSTRTPAERGDDLAWFNTQLSSRKESHTALIAIGSRQHHDDLWGVLIDNQSWASIVEQAHDRDCPLPRHEMVLPEGHDEWGETTCPTCLAHVDCLLWPEKRTMAWLEDQRFATDNEDHFEMVYNNFTQPASALYITKADIERAYNRDRALGSIPEGTVLIAGLDPASVNLQASFLWAYHPGEDRRYMVDLDVERGGGLSGARRIIKEWHTRYGVKMWIIERNGFQSAILEDSELLEYTNSAGISLKPHFTDRFNKWDASFGVTKQFTLFRTFAPVTPSAGGTSGVETPKIDIPYGDNESVVKAHMYRDRLLAFETAKKSTETDIVMAAWFPETEIRNWDFGGSTEVIYEYNQTGYGIEMLGDNYLSNLSYEGA